MCFVNWPNGNSFLFLNVICEIANLSKFLVILRNHLQTYDQGVIKGLLRRWASDQFSPHAWIGSHRRMRSVSWANRPVGAHPSPNQTSAVQLDRLTWSRRAWLLISSGLVGGSEPFALSVDFTVYAALLGQGTKSVLPPGLFCWEVVLNT